MQFYQKPIHEPLTTVKTENSSITSGIPPIRSLTQSCPTLCDPMDCSMPGFPVHHQLPELSQTQGFPSNTLLYPHPAPFLPASVTLGHHESYPSL